MELERVWKRESMTEYELLYRHFSGVIIENH
jgi:hypothetical protein